MTIKVVDTFEGLIALEDYWNKLYQKCSISSIFSSWEWARTWWEIYQDQGQRKLFILCFYRHDELVGIAPFQIDSSFPKSVIQGKTLRFIGAGERRKDTVVSQYLDFMVLPGLEEKMTTIISQSLIENKAKWNFADFEYVLKDALVLKCFNDEQRDICRQKIEYGFRYFVPKMEDFDQYLSKMGKRWRKMFVKKSRIMNRDGEVNIEFSSSQKLASVALHDLAEIHCSRWKQKAGDCIFKSQRFYRFHEKILDRLVPQNKAFIKTISLDGDDLASYYVFTDKEKIHYYQSGFFSEYANRYSPLFLLVCHEVGDAIKNNKQFDFMYADSVDSYKKDQYAADYETMYRLKWSTHPFRFFVFNCAKAIQNKVLNFKIKIN